MQRTFGLLSHILLTDEDRQNQQNFKDCVRNYFAINTAISQKYLRELALCLNRASFTLAMVSSLKNPTELRENKINTLEILQNLSNAGESVIASLSHGALDIWKTVAKLLVKKTAGKGNKENEYLLPYAVTIFRNLEVDSRSSIIPYFEKLIGLGTLLKEQGISIPKKVSLRNIGN